MEDEPEEQKDNTAESKGLSSVEVIKETKETKDVNPGDFVCLLCTKKNPFKGVGSLKLHFNSRHQ